MQRERNVLSFRRAGIALLAALGIMSVSSAVPAATTNRYTIDDNGNFLIFGNTSGYDCRDSVVQKPIVGDVQQGLLGLPILNCNQLVGDSDNGIDFFWRSQQPGVNQASADLRWGPAEGRTTAVVQLPTGAQVLMARLYWAAQRFNPAGAGTKVTFDRPGGFSRVVQADSAASKVTTIGRFDYYQSSADVTRDLQVNRSGAYRVSQIESLDVRGVNEDVTFIAWNIVVFYHLDGEPIRNLSLFDGLERVSTGSGSTTTVNLNGFSVPTTGFDAKLGVIAYEGDSEITGDQLKVNGTAISNTYNPVNNFFNRTSTNLNALAPRAGDLPQMSGQPGSMAGLDTDIIDITGQIKAGDTTVKLDATTSGDEYFLGVFATAVSTIRPVFSNTVKTVTNLSRSDGRFLPGDDIQYTITTKNTGNDLGTKVTLTDTLPAGITYKAGSLRIESGYNMGAVTDAKNDDQGQFDSNTNTITFFLGKNATATMGGDLDVNESTSVSFKAKIDAAATGAIVNKASISSLGKTSSMQGGSPVTWPSGDGSTVNVGTPVVISTCSTNADCPISAPICDTTTTPPECICRTNADCQGGRVCDPTTKQCVECVPPDNSHCDPNGSGGLCLPNDTCGCNTNTDCGGRTCDTTTHTCPAVSTDLSVTLTRTPSGVYIPPGTQVTYTLTATNNGTVPINDALLSASLAPNLPGAMWTCVGQGGAVCPAASGTAPLSTYVDVPAGGKLVYTFTGTTSSDPASSTLDFTGSLQPPHGYVDTNPGDNVVTDSVVIGIPPMGPDLSVTVTEKPSTTDNSVDYTVQVTNHGPGQADSATVTYTVPPGADVSIMPGDGWNCDRPNNGTQVICTRTAPIPVGDASPIVINVKGMPGQTMLPLHIEVGATDGTGAPLSDPNPADNIVDRTTTLTRFQLAGGGLPGSCDCSMLASSAHPAPGAPALTLAGLFGLALLLRSRRSRSRTSMN